MRKNNLFIMLGGKIEGVLSLCLEGYQEMTDVIRDCLGIDIIIILILSTFTYLVVRPYFVMRSSKLGLMSNMSIVFGLYFHQCVAI